MFPDVVHTDPELALSAVTTHEGEATRLVM